MHNSLASLFRMRRILDVIRSVLALLGLTVLLVTCTPLVMWWGQSLAGGWPDTAGEVLIVLGAAVGQDGIMAPSSFLRSEYAVRAYREGGFRTILVCGGGQPVPAATLIADYLRFHQVPPAVILIESGSLSTRENATGSRQLLERLPGRKVLLTSDFHMFRAIRVFRKAGIDIAPRPIPDVVKRGSHWRGRWPAFLDLVEETVKIGYYYVRGWL